MKVILLQDVAKIGLKGSIADVPNGYAMNSLIPNGKAAPATGGALKAAKVQAAASAAGAADAAASFASASKTLADNPLTIEATMNDQDHLFEAISADAVVAAAASAGATITADMVQFEQPIKAAGEHTVSLVAGSDSATFTLTVTKAA